MVQSKGRVESIKGQTDWGWNRQGTIHVNEEKHYDGNSRKTNRYIHHTAKQN